MVVKMRKIIALLFFLIVGLIKFLFYGRKADILVVDTPIHTNLGDQAIALAEIQFLTSIPQKKLFEVSAIQYDKLSGFYAKHFNKNGIVTVHGGGFLGCLWPKEEERFRKILVDFSSHRIIVLPQTITFDLSTEKGKKLFQESYNFYSAHKDITICLREKKSFEFMKTNMPEISCILTPDIVTVMQIEKLNYKKRENILFCIRRDHEKKVSSEDIKKIEKEVKQHHNYENIEWTDTVLDLEGQIILPNKREKLVGDKLRQFSKSRLVVTDRLHGMVFAALTGTPCIALPNTNLKVKMVYDWIKELSYVKYLDSIEDLDDCLSGLDLNKTYTYNYDLVNDKFDNLRKLIMEY